MFEYPSANRPGTSALKNHIIFRFFFLLGFLNCAAHRDMELYELAGDAAFAMLRIAEGLPLLFILFNRLCGNT